MRVHIYIYTYLYNAYASQTRSLLVNYRLLVPPGTLVVEGATQRLGAIKCFSRKLPLIKDSVSVSSISLFAYPVVLWLMQAKTVAALHNLLHFR